MKVKFVCLNLWHGGTLWDEIVAFLKDEKPDIIALQEVYRSDDRSLDKRYRSLEELGKELKMSNFAFAPAFQDVRFEKAQMGNGVLSRWPVQERGVVFYDVPYDDEMDEREDFARVPRNLQHVEVRVGEGTLNLFNTQGIWGFDGYDNERRLKMARTIVEEIGDKKEVVLAGDFNVREGTKTIEIIEGKLNNIFKGEFTSTFNLKHKKGGGFATAVVDMIFVSDDVKVVQHYMPKVNVTDHMPLVAVLEV